MLAPAVVPTLFPVAVAGQPPKPGAATLVRVAHQEGVRGGGPDTARSDKFRTYQRKGRRLLSPMSDRHLRDLDRATVLALRTLTLRPESTPDGLTRMLHQRWWLGLGQPAPVVHAQRTADRRALGPCPPWRTWGERWDHAAYAGDDLVRLYLACAPGTALQTVAAVSDRAQRWDEPWLLTSRALGQQVPRPDATTLLVPVTSLDALRAELEGLIDDLRPFLASRAPLLTLHVTRGVGLAQNPPRGVSFGEHRCRLVATTARAHRDAPLPEVQRQVQAAFWQEGVDPRRPYRRADARWQWHRERLVA